MNKITVTKEQQREIDRIKGIPTSELRAVIESAANGTYAKEDIRPTSAKVLAGLPAEKIAAAWLGVADVEPEYATPEEIIQAIREKKTFLEHVGKDTYEYKYDFKNDRYFCYHYKQGLQAHAALWINYFFANKFEIIED